MKRPVKIVECNGAWLVEYLDIGKRGRHLAAQFYTPDTTLDEVLDWVMRNPKLELQQAPVEGLTGRLNPQQP